MGPDPEPVAPPEPTYRTQELSNETLRFATVTGGSNEQTPVQVPEGALDPVGTVYIQYACPVTMAEDAVVAFLDPSGQEIKAMDLGGNEYCPFVDPSYEYHDEATLDPMPGAWTIETRGSCDCTVRVVLRAEVPE